MALFHFFPWNGQSLAKKTYPSLSNDKIGKNGADPHPFGWPRGKLRRPNTRPTNRQSIAGLNP
jgi:hypothetical protein